VELVPEEWLISEALPDAGKNRSIYEQFLLTRLSNSFIFLKEAQHARKAII
jgi:hypothetical protein